MLALFKFRRSAAAKHRASTISGLPVALGASNIPVAQYRRALTFVSPYSGRLALVAALGWVSAAVGRERPYFSRLLSDDALVREHLHALCAIAVVMVVVTIAGFALN